MMWGSRTVTWRRPDSSGRCCSNCTQNRVPSAMLMERLPVGGGGGGVVVLMLLLLFFLLRSLFLIYSLSSDF